MSPSTGSAPRRLARRRRTPGPPRDHVKARLVRLYEALEQRFGPQRWWPGRTAYEVAVGAVLTQHTAWTNAARAVAALRALRLLRPRRLAALGGLRAGARVPRGALAIRSGAVQRVSCAPRRGRQDALPDGAALRALPAALRSPRPRPSRLNAPAGPGRVASGPGAGTRGAARPRGSRAHSPSRLGSTTAP